MVINKKKAHNQPTICAVCEAPTSYHHYNIACCYGCRSFFRTWVVNNRNYKCKSYKQCKGIFLKLCKGCRQKKCIEVGLDKDKILVGEMNKREQKLDKWFKGNDIFKVSSHFELP